MDDRARRLGENEILFREVNAQMRALDEKLSTTADEPYPFLCECGNNTCTERIQVTVAEYERIHADPARFVIVRGHEKPDIEDVIEEREGYSVIRKREGGPAELAAEHAPRA